MSRTYRKHPASVPEVKLPPLKDYNTEHRTSLVASVKSHKQVRGNYRVKLKNSLYEH
jgi:hypothetical protein